MCFYWFVDQKVAFLLKILVRNCKKHKKVKKQLRFIGKIVKKARNPLFYSGFERFWASPTLLGRRRGPEHLPRQ